MVPEVLFFVANLGYCAAYLVREMLWLRVLSIVAATLTLPYFFLQPQVLYSAIAWQLGFLLINLVNLGWLLFERRPAGLSSEQQHLKNLVFGSFSQRDTLRLLSLATWREAAPGEELLAPGQQTSELLLLYSGVVCAVPVAGTPILRSAGTFVGELHYLTQEPTSAVVTAQGQVRYLGWRRADLERLFHRHPLLGKAFESLLAIDVARKLSQQPAEAAGQSLSGAPA